MMLKVLGRSTSINVRKVLWTCDELGLGFDNEAWGAGTLTTKAPEFLALNPNGLVPVLVDGDLVLWESNTICRYLSGREGRLDLLPAAPAERAQVERWMDWQAGELNNAWRYAFLSLVRKSPPEPDPQRLAASVAEWNRHMRMLDNQLAKTGAYVAGNSFTLADIVLGLAAHRWRMTPIARAELPAVQAWLRRLDQRPAFKAWGNANTP